MPGNDADDDMSTSHAADPESARLKSERELYRRGGLQGSVGVSQQDMENVNAKTVQLVKILSQVGPDIPEISRKLGQFKESVRYRYKEKLLNRGIAVQAAVDHERLGLKRLILIAEVPEPYKSYAQAIFSAMNELCYVIAFSRTLVGGEEIIHVSAPAQKVGELRDFFQTLKEKGMFSKLEILEFDWRRAAPMRAEFYDFDTGRWDFEWQQGGSDDFGSATYTPSEPCKFDYVDLLIIKELQMDANRSLKEISDKLGINYKKLAWHHTSHVLARNMIAGYSVNWMGTRYDYTLEKVLHRKHRYFVVDIFVRNVNELESMTLRRNMNRLPFLWSEAGGRNYYAALALPVDNVVEGLQYIGAATSTVRDRVSLYPGDQTEAASFTVSYKLYDSANKQWTFNKAALLERFEKLMVEIKAGATREV
jgi:DNA-binding Lrp family transcriptional regulator